LKRGLDALSGGRVEDTLLAEAGDNAALIEIFRNGKSEHNRESLRNILGDSFETDLKILKDLGFLESIGSNFKIPMLYRSGLNITQGKAFAAPPTEEDDDDE
jgi:hypothetical protein